MMRDESDEYHPVAVDRVVHRGREAQLVLADPRVLGMAESLCGDDLIPVHSVCEIYGGPCPLEIPWHQNAFVEREVDAYVFSFVLDDVAAGSGARSVVPGSHRATVDVCAFEKSHGWDGDEIERLALDAGDLVIAHQSLLWGAERSTDGELRRYLSFEFWRREDFEGEPQVDMNVIHHRRILLAGVLLRRKESLPDGEHYVWPHSSIYNFEGDVTAHNIIVGAQNVPAPRRPANLCLDPARFA